MSLSYDSNGNVLNDCNHTYTWDADGNSVTVDSVGLTYDALDRMVEQNRSGSYTQIVYGPGGGKLALMSGQSLQKAFVPLPGQATAVYTSSGLDHYRHSDWLGSARLTSSPTQSTGFLSSIAYAPFGETYASSGTADASFTGMNPDTTGSTNSSDYDFLAREYSNEGRWVSPDPAGLAAVDPSNPQSWNRYSYVWGSPLNFVDPLGLFAQPRCETAEYGCPYPPEPPADCPAPLPLCWGPSPAPPSGCPPPLICSTGGGGAGGGGGSASNGPKQPTQKCADARAKVASLAQQLRAQNPTQLFKTNMKELRNGAAIGCVVGAVAETYGTAGLGAPFAPGACAVVGIVGAMTAEGVFVLSNAGEIWAIEATTARFWLAETQAALACRQ